MQIQKGDDYTKLKPTYFVGILNFGIGFGKEYLAKHYCVEEETGQSVLNDIQHRFIQLTKFKKKRHELVSLVDKWTFFLKNAKNLTVIPDDLADEGLKIAYQEADRHTWNKEDLIAYDNICMREQDQRGERELAKEEGKKEGIQEGIKEGIKEGKKKGIKEGIKEIILTMYDSGMPLTQIAKIAKKTEVEVSLIIEKHRK